MTVLLFSFCVLSLCGCGELSNPYAGEEGLTVLHNHVTQDPKGFDPVRASDVLSNRFINQIYDCLYQYSYLDRPYRVEPCLAESMPEISEDKLTYTIRMKKGVRFQDDPCFAETGGKGREVTAHDFVYSWKRLADQNNKPEGYWIFQGYIEGLDEFSDDTVEVDKEKKKKKQTLKDALDKIKDTCGLTNQEKNALRLFLLNDDEE